MSNITIGMQALLSRQELEQLIRKKFPTLKTKGWTPEGHMVVSVDLATMQEESYEKEKFFMDRTKQFVLVKKDRWVMNIQ